MLEVKEIHKDARGQIFRVAYGDREIGILVSTNAGFARGGHYHKNDQHMYVVKGEFEFTTMELGRKESEKKRLLKEGDFVIIPKGIAHMMVSRTESVFFESMIGGYNAENYGPYRRIVEEKLARSK